MSIAARSILGFEGGAPAPASFRYVAIKVIASRGLRTSASLSTWQNTTTMMQIGDVQFLTASGSLWSIPSGTTVSLYGQYNGRRRYSSATQVSNYNSGEDIGRLFDNNQRTKWGPYSTLALGGQDVYDYDSGEVLYYDNTWNSCTKDYIISITGAYNALSPVAIVLDLGGSPLDITTYSKWRFKNANDNASQKPRTWIEGEILGSEDKLRWWRMDVFNNTSIVNTNYAIAHTADLTPTPGDLWFGLDLATRDWTHGIPIT